MKHVPKNLLTVPLVHPLLYLSKINVMLIVLLVTIKMVLLVLLVNLLVVFVKTQQQNV